MESTIGKYLRIRLFLEGVEVPVIGAMVQMTINFPAIASIQIVPIDEVEDFKEGLMVHLFYYDFLEEGEVEENEFSRYKLLFCGETTGLSLTQSSLGRSAVLQCADFSANWQRCYQYMVTYGPNGNMITPEAKNYAAGSDKLNNIIDGHLAVLGRYINSTPKSPGLRGTKGLLGGILTLIEQFGGVIGHRRGVNDWFSYQELRNKIMQQIAAEDSDDTAQKLFNAKEFYEWLENGLVQLGEICTLYDMIRLLFQYIYYEAAPIMSPLYVKGTDPDKFLDTEKINNILREVATSLYDNKDFKDIKLRALSAKKNLSLLDSYQYLSDRQINLVFTARSSLELILSTNTYSAEIQKYLNEAKKNVLAAIIKLDKIEKETIKVERLNTVVFKPECYFVAPPRCSVIFPEQNTQFSYSRNYTQEYTRLRLQSGLMFNIDSEKLLADYCYAPSGTEIKRYIKQQNEEDRKALIAAGDNPKKDQRVMLGMGSLLPWERYTGILPKFEYIQEINYVSNKKSKEEQKNVQGLARSYKQKAANFNFYKYRFMARQLTGSCRLNPMLIVGFPLVVIREPFIVDRQKLIDLAKQRGTSLNSISSQDIIENIKEFSTELGAPLQYIAYPTTISHMIDQNGASTSYSCTHARPHRITNDNFLTLFENTARDEKMTTVTKRTVLDYDAIIKNRDFISLKYLIDLTSQSPSKEENKTEVKPSKSILDAEDESEIISSGGLIVKETKPKLKVDGFDVFNVSFRSPPKNETADLLEFKGATKEQEIEEGTIKIPVDYGILQVGGKGKLGTITAIRVVNDLIRKIDFEGKEYYVWSSIVVYEDVEEVQRKSIPIEHVLRPSWFSANYSNLFIGKEIYGKFIGCGSVVDEIVFSSPEGLSIQGAGSGSNQILDDLAKTQDLLRDVKGLTQTKLVDAPSVETAIDVLAFQYGEVVKNGLDVNRFVNDYTYRPIATMEDILGSEDLELEVIGNDIKTVKGRLGFHSVAVSGETNLRGLLSDPSLPIENRINKRTIPISIDTRKERKESVQKYVDKLRLNSGEVIGLRG